MTAIIRFGIDKCPMIMGDILLSADKGFAKEIHLPTVKDYTNKMTEQTIYVPAGLRQKIAVIPDKLMIGFAGDVDAAINVISEIFEINRKRPFSIKTFSDYFNSIGKSVLDKVGFTGFIEDENKVVSFSCEHTEDFTHPTLGKIGVLGSGAMEFRSALNGFQFGKIDSQYPLNQVEKSISVGLGLAGTLLNFEIVTLKTLEDSFGAGYELATIVNKNYGKVDDLAYIFWKCLLTESGLKIGKIPMKVCRYSYEGDLLLIHALDFKMPSENAPPVERLFGITPIYRELCDEDYSKIRLPSLNTSRICNVIMYPHVNGGMEAFSLVTRKSNAQDKAWIHFDESNPEFINIGVEERFYSTVLGEINARRNASS